MDGAIHRAGGKGILEDCKKIIARQGGCNTGEAVITTAGSLPAKFVIHTVGPVWNGGNKNEPAKLANCYRNSLNLAAVFYFENYYLFWSLLFLPVCFFIFRNGLKENSFYFLVVTILYAYIGLSYVFIRLLFTANDGDESIYLAIIYFIVSGIGLIWLFIHYNKIIKINAGV